MPDARGPLDVAVVVPGPHGVASVDEDGVEVVQVPRAVGHAHKGRQVQARLKVDLLVDLAPEASELKALELQGEDVWRGVDAHALGGLDVGVGLRALVLVAPLQDLCGREALQGPLHGAGVGDLEAEVQELLKGVGLVLAVHALDLAAEPPAEYPPKERGAQLLVPRRRGLALVEALEAPLVQGVEEAPQVLMGVLLAAWAEALGDDPEAAGMRGRRHRPRLAAERPDHQVLGHLHQVCAPSGRGPREALPGEASLGQGRRVDEALKDRVHEACVPEVHQACARPPDRRPLHLERVRVARRRRRLRVPFAIAVCSDALAACPHVSRGGCRRRR